MGMFDFIDPIASAVFGGGSSAVSAKPKTPVQLNPVPVRLTLPAANPDWNTATVKIPTPSQHGWSGHSLQSYLQTFQRGGGPAPGQQIATTQSLFPTAGGPVAPDWGKLPDVVQSLVKNSVGGDMSPAAAALYGRMLGATPPPVVAASSGNAPVKPVNPNPNNYAHVGGSRGMQNTQYDQGFSAGQNSLYKGMTPLQRQQAQAVYNVTQPVSPTLR
jgi:hypothetical protein